MLCILLFFSETCLETEVSKQLYYLPNSMSISLCKRLHLIASPVFVDLAARAGGKTGLLPVFPRDWFIEPKVRANRVLE
jgi:hypothetical protein